MTKTVTNEIAAPTHYDNAKIALTAVIRKLEVFYSARKEMLNDRDLLIVHDSIKTAEYLTILINEHRARLTDRDAEALVGTIYDHAVVAWAESSAKSIAVVDIVKVYHAERDLVSYFYTAEKRKSSGIFKNW